MSDDNDDNSPPWPEPENTEQWIYDYPFCGCSGMEEKTKQVLEYFLSRLEGKGSGSIDWDEFVAICDGSEMAAHAFLALLDDRQLIEHGTSSQWSWLAHYKPGVVERVRRVIEYCEWHLKNQRVQRGLEYAERRLNNDV